ncbi:hypothetical protein Tco_0891991, partial [Tanacetum coccineum]
IQSCRIVRIPRLHVYVPYVPEPAYPKFMPLEDEPAYVPESDPEADDDEDPEEDPADGRDDGDDEDESSDDDEDDDVDIEEDEEEEEHLAPADSTAVALPAVDHAPSTEETESFEIDESAATPPPHPVYRVTARISIRDEPPTPFWSDTEIPLPPLPVSSPVPVISPSPPASPIRSLGYRAAMIRLRAEASSTSHSLPLPPPIILSHTRLDAPSSGIPPLLTILLHTSSPPLHLLSTDRRADRPEVTLLPQKRLGIALGPRYEVGESSSSPNARPPGGIRTDYSFVATINMEIMRDLERDVGYGITDTWDEMLVDMLGAPATDDTELGRRYRFTTRVSKTQTRSIRGGSTLAVIIRVIAADRKEQFGDYERCGNETQRQAQFIEALKLQKRLQTQMIDAKGPAQPDPPEEAGSSS